MFVDLHAAPPNHTSQETLQLHIIPSFSVIYYLNLNNIINKGKVPSRAAVTSLVKRAITRQAASCWYSA